MKDCLFGGAILAKNADPNKYVYSGYGIRFHCHSVFSLPEITQGLEVNTRIR